MQQAAEALAPYQERLDLLLSIVAAEHSLTPAQITSAGKTRRILAAKRDAALLAVECFCARLTPPGIAALMNLGRATFYRLLAEAKVTTDPAVLARRDVLRARVREALATTEAALV
jgi:hypothetical protein